MNNIYEVFACNTKEELYKKMILGVDEVNPLLEFFEYAKMSIGREKKSISSQKALFETVSKIQPPTKDSAGIIFVDTKNSPVHFSRMSLNQKKDIRRVLAEGLNAGAANIFIATHEDSDHLIVNNFIELSRSIKLNVLDKLTYFNFDKEYYSHRSYDSYYLDKVPEIIKETKNMDKMAYNNLDKFHEYAEFYAQQEIEGLNIIEDIELIKEKLKLGFQFERQEVLGYLSYDHKNNIINLNPQFKGGISASIIDTRVILRDLLQEKDMKGFILFHNHPSGKTTPSQEDQCATKELYESVKKLDIELADHFIIGKEEVLSLAKEGYIYNSFNNTEHIDKACEVKEQARTYDLLENEDVDTEETIAEVIQLNNDLEL